MSLKGEFDMADEDNFLDTFLKPDDEQSEGQNNNTNDADVSLEDEFTKLLKDFIGQDSEPAPQSNEPAQESSLDSFETEPESPENNNDVGGLDGFVSEDSGDSLDSFESAPSEEKQPEAAGLDGFVTPAEESGLDNLVSSEETPVGEGSLEGMISETAEEPTEKEDALKSEEQELARAISNFQDGVTAMASNKNLKMPKTDYTEAMLKPNYKPSVGKKIAQYLLACWDIINRYDPENMKRLSPEATDEEYLAFAESVSDVYLQLSIISYVEILINIEICEVSYEQKKELALKNKIKRELYEEYMELQARKNMFIQKLKEKKFPIDADKLINNYFRAAQKDADGAFEALTKNPAMFSRIEIEKMRPKFFGLIKVTPEDGVKMNQKIGKYIKKQKV